MTFFDSHSHPNDEKFDGDTELILEHMRETGVAYTVCVGSDMKSSGEAIAFSGEHENVFAAVGIHPHEASSFVSEDLETLRLWLHQPRVVALGEIGLDYFYDYSPRATQKEVCLAQMELAFQEKMPVIFHIRDAHGDTLELMRAHKSRLPGGIIHCFSGSAETAKEYLRLGYYISFAGPVTFKKAPNLWEAAKVIPDDRLLIETDSPYLAPVPMRGQRNEPANVRYVAEKLAELRGTDVETIARLTMENALRVYGISAS